MEMKVTLSQELESRFPRGYGMERNEAMEILRARSGDFNNELIKVTDRLRAQLKEKKL
jgi:hypothetical protein